MEKKYVILLAEDDVDDQMFVKKAYEYMKKKTSIILNVVGDGEELLSYLEYRNGYNEENAPKPDLILIDLNMPKKHGLESIEEIKEDDELKIIPILILSSSKEKEDIEKGYLSGANSYITKPETYQEYIKIMFGIEDFWLEIAKLPGGKNVD
ncbi:MAG TPA: response regulator [Candidatus Paceibacterota bacterium]|nr:response regulator [Candidatus Paceibacterota bacterium]